MSTIRSVGIVGLGSFGRFVATLVPKHVQVCGHDPLQTLPASGVKHTSLAETMASDVVILAVPLDVIATVLDDIKDMLEPDTVVVDVCSVKMHLEGIFSKHLPQHGNVLLAHPLFGPQSAAKSIKGHRLIVTKSLGDRADEVIRYCGQTLGLDVRRMNAAQHDRAMARVHVLTLFVARGLRDMGLPSEELITPSYQMILDLIGLDQAHSEELFRTIQLGNPFAADTRQELLANLAEVDQALQKKGTV